MTSRITKITSLWRCGSERSVRGEYFKGIVGDCYFLLFHNPSNHPKAPAFDLCTAPKTKPKDTPPTYAAKRSGEEEVEWGGEDDAYPVEGEQEKEEEIPWEKGEGGEMPESEDEDTETPW